MVKSSFPDNCPCCNNEDSDQNLEHWLLKCSSFEDIRKNTLNNLDIVLSHFINDNDNTGNNSEDSNVDNSVSVNENLSVNNLSVNNLSVNENNCSNLYNFLLGGRRNSNRNNNEWKNLYHCQTKTGNLTDIPFLAKTAALFNSIMPIVSAQRWSVINSHSNKVTKGANAENTVRQARSARVHISAYAHATERNRNSSSGSQTQ